MPRTHELSLALAAALAGFASAPAAAQSLDTTLPAGGAVAAGSAAISQPDGRQLRIEQSTARAIINWQSFSIGADARVTFAQPSASAVALNRVLGADPSQILGRLDANGQVFLSNPNGVLFAQGASVNVGGLFATTLSIDDADFLAGRDRFYNAGAAGTVTNSGSIQTPSGYAALAGPQVRNDGIIVAHRGTIALAAADRVSLDMVGDGLITVSVDQAALNALAANSGTLQADGGRVIMSARSANALLDTVVDNSGVLRAHSLVERSGEIVLDGGTSGTLVSTGVLDTDGTITVSAGAARQPAIVAAPRLDGGTIAAGLSLFPASPPSASRSSSPLPGGAVLLDAGNVGAPRFEMSIVGTGVSLPADVNVLDK